MYSLIDQRLRVLSTHDKALQAFVRGAELVRKGWPRLAVKNERTGEIMWVLERSGKVLVAA